MGLIRKTNIDRDCLMGLWEIKEDYKTLLSKVNLTPFDIHRMDAFKSEGRKVESLSVRALLQTITEPTARIVYNEFRKPFLSDGSYNISISHSYLYTAILLSKTKRVGIDLEYMSHRIERIAGKFINAREYITPELADQSEHLYVHWCAKEALYKICDKQNINFQDNITIKPFTLSPEQQGEIVGVVDNAYMQEEFNLHYEVSKNYVIVYTSAPNWAHQPASPTTAR